MDPTTIERVSVEVIHGKVISEDPIYLLVPVLWFALMVANYFLFDSGRDAASRRKRHPRAVIFNSVFFVIVATACAVLEHRSLSGRWVLVILVPGTWMVSSLIIHSTKFCDQCDSPVRPPYGTSSPGYCPNCGAIISEGFYVPDEDSE